MNTLNDFGITGKFTIFTCSVNDTNGVWPHHSCGIQLLYENYSRKPSTRLQALLVDQVGLMYDKVSSYINQPQTEFAVQQINEHASEFQFPSAEIHALQSTPSTSYQ